MNSGRFSCPAEVLGRYLGVGNEDPSSSERQHVIHVGALSFYVVTRQSMMHSLWSQRLTWGSSHLQYARVLLYPVD